LKYSPFLSCREAAVLITAELDRPLTRFERIGLDLHLRICSACPIVIDQLRYIRQSMQDWRDRAEGDVIEARPTEPSP
jgi:hypothetical protein